MKIKDFIKQLQQYDPDTEILGDYWLAEAIAENADISLEEAHDFIKYQDELECNPGWAWDDIQLCMNDWEFNKEEKL